jgi:sialic acid synthase SpsE
MMKMINIVAEIGSTWLRPTLAQSHEAALSSIYQAAKAGATVVKFQLGLGNLFNQKTAPKQWETTQKYNLPFDWLFDLRTAADVAKVQLHASVFDPALFSRQDINKLLGIKLASGELTPNSESLLRMAANFCADNLRPLILSTGTHTDRDIGWALDILRMYSRLEIIIMNCVSQYPAHLNDYSLEAMNKYRPGYHRQVSQIGLSDHTPDNWLIGRAVLLGYTVFEKHFMLDDCPKDNPDYGHSLTPEEFGNYAAAIRRAEVDWILGEAKVVRAVEMKEVKWMQRGKDGRRPRDDI